MAARTAAEVVLAGEAADADRAGRATSRLDERGRASFTLRHRRRVGAGASSASAAATRSATRCWPRPWRCGAGMPLAELGRALGRSAAGLDPKDGCLRPGRRCHGHRRLVQRQPGLDRGRAAGARRDRAGAAAGRRARLPGRARRAGAGRPRGGRAARRRARAWTVLIVVGTAAGPISDGAAAVAGWGGESVQVTDQDEAVALLRAQLRPGDVVLVKGSRYRTWAGRRRAARARSASRSTRRSRREGGLRRGRRRLPHLDPRHAAGDQGVHPAQGRPADPHRRARRRT